MKTNSNVTLVGAAAAITLVGVFWFAVPSRTFAVLGIVFVCPLMMFLMMRGMGGGKERGPDDQESRHDHPSQR